MITSRFKLGILTVCAGILASSAFAGDALRAPSGHEMTFQTVSYLDADGGLSAHFQFLWPAILEVELQAEMAMTEGDTLFFCQHFASPYLQAAGINAARVGISFSDQPIEFGVAMPDAVQVFESYALNDGICEWEAF